MFNPISPLTLHDFHSDSEQPKGQRVDILHFFLICVRCIIKTIFQLFNISEQLEALAGSCELLAHGHGHAQPHGHGHPDASQQNATNDPSPVQVTTNKK